MKNSEDKSVTQGAKTVSLTESELKELTQFSPRKISDRYYIKRSLGSGSFGMVFLAEDRKLGRLVAIKQLFGALSDNPDIKRRFLQEAKIAGQLEHPNIVIVYNIEGEEDETFIVMEYLGGGSLEELLRKEGMLDIKTAGRIMMGILTGLDAAHSIMVVHRDVKPHNILFGINAVPKITDFGVALLPAAAGGVEGIDYGEEKYSVIGTPLYMSPEQIMMMDADCRTDLYSAGVIFYKMLSGANMFDLEKNSEMEDVKQAIFTSNPKRIEEFRSDAPSEFNDFLNKLLRKDPDERYASASEAMKALVQILSKIEWKEDPEALFAPTSKIINSPAAILEDIIYLLLVDGIITDTEREELKKRTERLGLSEIQSRALEEKVRKERKLPSLENLESFAELIKVEKDKDIIEKKRAERGISLEEARLIKKQIKGGGL
jgi:serine/threonine protein kinase